MRTPEEKAETKRLAIEELKKGLRDGTIKVSIVVHCGSCKKDFDNDAAFDSHLIDTPDCDFQTCPSIWNKKYLKSIGYKN